jgi:hypothetical protein
MSLQTELAKLKRITDETERKTAAMSEQFDRQNRRDDTRYALARAAEKLGKSLRPDALSQLSLDLVKVEGEWRPREASWRPLDEHIAELLTSSHDFLVEDRPAKKSPDRAQKPADGFDLDSFVPGQATDEQRRQLREAIARQGREELARRKG